MGEDTHAAARSTSATGRRQIRPGRSRWALWLCTAAVPTLCHCALVKQARHLAEPLDGGGWLPPTVEYEDYELKGLPVAGYTPESSLALGGLGVALKRPDPSIVGGRTSSIQLAGIYTLNGQQALKLEPDLYFAGGEYNLKGRLALVNGQDAYFGLGYATRADDRENYDTAAVLADARLRRRISKNLHLGVHYELSARSIAPQQPSANLLRSAFGRDGGTLSGLGVEFAWDSRDNAFAATRGTYVQGLVTGFHRLLGSDFEFLRYRLDARHYLDLGKKNILAFQGFWETLHGNVPFYALARLGGSKHLRGIFRGRYRDKNLMLGQVEYRTPHWWRLGLATFAGVGQVHGDSGDFSLGGLKWSAGVGLRFLVDEEAGINVRADFGVGPGGSTGFYFTIGEAF